jgi:hypothetical protein
MNRIHTQKIYLSGKISEENIFWKDYLLVTWVYTDLQNCTVLNTCVSISVLRFQYFFFCFWDMVSLTLSSPDLNLLSSCLYFPNGQNNIPLFYDCLVSYLIELSFEIYYVAPFLYNMLDLQVLAPSVAQMDLKDVLLCFYIDFDCFSSGRSNWIKLHFHIWKKSQKENECLLKEQEISDILKKLKKKYCESLYSHFLHGEQEMFLPFLLLFLPTFILLY